MGEVRVQLGFPLPCLKVVILNKAKVEHLVDFCQVQNEPGIVIVGAIVYENTRKSKLFHKIVKQYQMSNLVSIFNTNNVQKVKNHDITIIINV